jgi:hypothetical protein
MPLVIFKRHFLWVEYIRMQDLRTDFNITFNDFEKMQIMCDFLFVGTEEIKSRKIFKTAFIFILVEFKCGIGTTLFCPNDVKRA